ncbi:ORM1-like protein 3 [Artemia franciscana]|uniref:ORM1-like protein 3 n=1 Tax=Artemia franciscana TaxID=6661 RepID=UPI0032DAC288
MLIGTHGDADPNTSWLASRGMWFSYVAGVLGLHLVLLSIPLWSTSTAWTLTNIIHNLCVLVFMHSLKGAPFTQLDEGNSENRTHWEQIDVGVQWSITKKFLTVIPIALFFLASFYTKYDKLHFVINFISLLTVLVPKILPSSVNGHSKVSKKPM